MLINKFKLESNSFIKMKNWIIGISYKPLFNIWVNIIKYLLNYNNRWKSWLDHNRWNNWLISNFFFCWYWYNSPFSCTSMLCTRYISWCLGGIEKGNTISNKWIWFDWGIGFIKFQVYIHIINILSKLNAFI